MSGRWKWMGTINAASSTYETRVSSRQEEHSTVHEKGLRSEALYSAYLPGARSSDASALTLHPPLPERAQRPGRRRPLGGAGRKPRSSDPPATLLRTGSIS